GRWSILGGHTTRFTFSGRVFSCPRRRGPVEGGRVHGVAVRAVDSGSGPGGTPVRPRRGHRLLGGGLAHPPLRAGRCRERIEALSLPCDLTVWAAPPFADAIGAEHGPALGAQAGHRERSPSLWARSSAAARLVRICSMCSLAVWGTA